MKPTPKNPAIENFLNELGKELGFAGNRIESIESGDCVCCGEIADEFTDALSVKEYQISGLCQECQDRTFGE